MHQSWEKFYLKQQELEYFQTLIKTVDELYKNSTCYPKYEDIFNVLNMDIDEIKVVIIGQDPYINENEAHGYAFSTLNGSLTPSLKNISKELVNEGYSPLISGNLQKWVDQGIFLLNRVLTVTSGQSNSHKNIGWEIFTLNLIKYLVDNTNNLVFILWGNDAKKLETIITEKHLVLSSSHPSPLGAYKSFFNSNCFKNSNEYLKQNGKNQVDW